MTIHSSHPFAAAPGDRDPLRRFRGRMPSPVSVWTAGEGVRRAGWTLSSFLVADGRPAEVLGLLDAESDLAELLSAGDPEQGPPLVVNLLGWTHRQLADAFAGLAPAPGGVFTLAGWRATAWGPVLEGAPAWLGARVSRVEAAGWSVLVRAVIEQVEIGPDPVDGLLAYVRGRYRPAGLASAL